MSNDVPLNWFIQYQAMRISRPDDHYWEDRWIVSDKHPAHFLFDLEQNQSITENPPGNFQSWNYRIIFACKYWGEFTTGDQNDNPDTTVRQGN